MARRGYSGNGASATSAELSGPLGVALDAAGDVVVADSSNSAVRFVPVASGTHYGQAMTSDDIYTIAGDGIAGDSGSGGAASSAELSWSVNDATVDPAGDLYVTDSGSDVIRFVPVSSGTYYGQAMTSDDIYTVAGAGWGADNFSGDGGAATSATLDWPASAAPDPAGGFYIADYYNNRIRHVTVSFSTTIYTYDADGELLTTVSPDGNQSGANAANYTTTNAYDADGEVTSTTLGAAGSTVTPRVTTNTYDADGNLISVKDPRGYTTTNTYDADDQKVLVTDPDGNETLTCYDADGNVAETVLPVGVAANSLTPASCPTSYPAGYGERLAPDATTYTYDANGDETAMTTPAPAGQSGWETTSYTYDQDGNLLETVAPPTSNAVGAPNDDTYDTYNAADELAGETTGYGTSAASTTSYCYDPNGDTTAVVAPDGNTPGVATCETSYPWVVSAASWPTQASYQTTYSYDSAGELVSTTLPATSAAPSGITTSYTYDAQGNKLTSTDAVGVVTTYTYTPTNLVSSISYSGTSTHPVSYSYDANGNKTAMTDATGSSSYTYDPFGELTSAENGDGQTVGYSYNADGEVTGITYPLPAGAAWATTDTVAYAYDHADELTSVTDFNDKTISISNTADGLPYSETLGTSGDSIATTYDPTDSPSAIDLENGSNTLLGFSYSDAPSGAILAETDTPSWSREPADYTYDAQSRVTSMTPGSGSTLDYGFDASGDLTTLPAGATGTYDDAGELTSSVLSGTTTSYTYNADGEQLSAVQGSATIASGTWNGAGQLTSCSDPTADMSSTTYDGDGLRASELSTLSGGSPVTQNFVWNTDSSVPNLLMDSTNAYIFAGSGTPAEQVKLSSGAIVYLVADSLGSVRGAVASSGSLSGSVDYDAWGNPEMAGGLSSYTPFGFVGAYTDSTGMIYLIGRYYDPQTGQFLSVDPMVEQTGQAYAYAGDDPVLLSDPSGTDVVRSYTIVQITAIGELLAEYSAGAFDVSDLPLPSEILNVVALTSAEALMRVAQGCFACALYATAYRINHHHMRRRPCAIILRTLGPVPFGLWIHFWPTGKNWYSIL